MTSTSPYRQNIISISKRLRGVWMKVMCLRHTDHLTRSNLIGTQLYLTSCRNGCRRTRMLRIVQETWCWLLWWAWQAAYVVQIQRYPQTTLSKQKSTLTWLQYVIRAEENQIHLTECPVMQMVETKIGAKVMLETYTTAGIHKQQQESEGYGFICSDEGERFFSALWPWNRSKVTQSAHYWAMAG